ncbi:MAG: hypothetical protein IKT35_03130 [Clostridia bacterium]|nr:hypothetical protein [Clostridia bacterium]
MIYKVKTVDSIDAINWDTIEKAPIDKYKWIENCITFDCYAQLVYVKDWGFICRMYCNDSNPYATYENFYDPVYQDSCLEFFSSLDNVHYMNIESNCKPTILVGFGAGRHNRIHADEVLSPDQMFKVESVVNENGWTITMELPIEKLAKFYGDNISKDTFKKGYTFKGNFYKTGEKLPIENGEHYGMWSEVMTEKPDFHRPEYFGELVIE